MAEFLLEILSEEIPARMQARAASDLERLVTDKLKEARLDYDRAEAFVTPRRLALVVDGLPERQPDLSEERKGPRVGAPDKAIEGFLKSAGLDSVDQCEVREIKGSTFYFVVRDIAGRPVADVLADIVTLTFHEFAWPKSMKWGESGQFRWVRPVHQICMLFDGEIPARDVMVGGDDPELTSDPNKIGSIVRPLIISNTTSGHRFLAPEKITVHSFDDYRTKLRAAFVILDPAERRQIIAEQAIEQAAAEGLTVKDDPALLDEVTGLVEWPEVLIGTIDDAFMDLPDEVLETSMRSHQRYFSCLDGDDGLANRFLVVANMPAPEGSDIRTNIIAGNERVLRARLADARFFWDQDRRQSLASRVPALSDVVFHAKLGSLDAKADRVQALAVEIAKHVSGADIDRVRSAARLAKADLTTGMVGEFPELQGVMGRYYALNDGEHVEVADAIAEHYGPLGPGDACPSKPVSVTVALADKIDTLVGFWAIDEKPTGSKDPYALRRAALGVIRLIVENDLRLPLSEIFVQAQKAFHRVSKVPVEDPLLEFITDRMKVALRERGVRHDLIAAVFAVERLPATKEDDLVRLLARVDALQDFVTGDAGTNLLVAYQRAGNIVSIEAKKDKTTFDGVVDEGLLAEPAEKALLEELRRVETDSSEAIQGEDFGAAMAVLAKLRTPVDVFFDQVTVNTEESNLRSNRLELLSQIRKTMDRIADFSKIEG
ncbi:MAG: glycine--tRNA ligase subunit beta [Alphaproteobacteria bacterium]|nr:glycine--tRNA ligase subunit beta [Alphaproteobacteria bacterium]